MKILSYCYLQVSQLFVDATNSQLKISHLLLAAHRQNWIFGKSWPLNSKREPGFFKGYGKSRPADGDARVRQRLYIVYELIKYAFIRYARGKNYNLGRSFVSQCRQILRGIQ